MSARRSAARPKRAGETFARTHHLADDGPSSKKPRFDVRNPSALAPDAPEEDTILDLDEIGKGGQATKRNAVNIDGFESDSSNEGFDGRAAAKAREGKKAAAKSEAEETNDMFADLEEDFKDGAEDGDVAADGKKPKKDVRFLDEDEIQGQVADSKAGGHVPADFRPEDKIKGMQRMGRAESSSDSEEDDADDADVDRDVDEEVGAGGRKAHAPKLDAFNMKGEMEEGRFDAQGNFVRKAADPAAVHDSWLEGVSKRDMKRARDAAEKREEERRQKAIADDQLLTADVLGALISRLAKGETVLEALARLGTSAEKKKKPRWQNKNRNRKKQADEMDVDADEAANGPAEIRRLEAVEAITGGADQLLTRGQTDIYQDSREQLLRQYRRETGEDWVDAPVEQAADERIDGARETKQWEYRWTDARDGGEAHGPYDGAMMVAWADAGFFGDSVEYRRVDLGPTGEWSRSVDFV